LRRVTDPKSSEVRRILERYLVEVVEAYELCPWAKSARENGELTVDIVRGTPSIGEWVVAANAALATPTTRVAMIVAPDLSIDRDAFSRVRDEVAARIPTAGVAHFHPDARLELASPAKLVPFVRRSPDPLLQLVPLAILDSIRNTPPPPAIAQQTQMLGGHAAAPREDVAERIARVNHATVIANLDAITRTLDDIARDRATAYSASL
jgi:hypothetical protein